MTAPILGIKHSHALFRGALSVFVNAASIVVPRDVKLGYLVLLETIWTTLQTIQ